MPYFSMAMRSMPIPQAKPWNSSGSRPQFLKHIRMHHAAAEDLQPILAFAEADLAAFPRALDVDLGRRFGEGEEGGTKSDLHVSELEEGFAEFLENPLQMAEMAPLIDDKALDLMKHGQVRLVRGRSDRCGPDR